MRQFYFRQNQPFISTDGQYVVVYDNSKSYCLYEDGSIFDLYSTPPYSSWYELKLEEFWGPFGTEIKGDSKKRCSCDSFVLFNKGCQCGGI